MIKRKSEIVATVTVENTKGAPLPLWLRTSFVGSDGTVYLPAAAFMNEQAAMLCAGHDGISIVSDKKHIYLPSSWLASEYPENREDIEAIVVRVLEGYETPETV